MPKRKEKHAAGTDGRGNGVCQREKSAIPFTCWPSRSSPSCCSPSFFFFLSLRQQLYKWFFPNSLFSSRLLLGRNWIQHIGRHMPRSCVKYIIPPDTTAGRYEMMLNAFGLLCGQVNAPCTCVSVQKVTLVWRGKKERGSRKREIAPFFSLSPLYYRHKRESSRKNRLYTKRTQQE